MTGASQGPDHRGARRLGGRETAIWYLIAAVTYVGASIAHKGVLNWIIGPAWLVLTVWWGPILLDTLRGRR